MESITGGKSIKPWLIGGLLSVAAALGGGAALNTSNAVYPGELDSVAVLEQEKKEEDIDFLQRSITTKGITFSCMYEPKEQKGSVEIFESSEYDEDVDSIKTHQISFTATDKDFNVEIFLGKIKSDFENQFTQDSVSFEDAKIYLDNLDQTIGQNYIILNKVEIIGNEAFVYNDRLGCEYDEESKQGTMSLWRSNDSVENINFKVLNDDFDWYEFLRKAVEDLFIQRSAFSLENYFHENESDVQIDEQLEVNDSEAFEECPYDFERNFDQERMKFLRQEDFLMQELKKNSSGVERSRIEGDSDNIFIKYPSDNIAYSLKGDYRAVYIGENGVNWVWKFGESNDEARWFNTGDNYISVYEYNPWIFDDDKKIETIIRSNEDF